MHDRRDDALAVSFDLVVELLEHRDLGTARPLKPVIEHPDRGVGPGSGTRAGAVPQQVGAVEPVVVFRDPGELRLLAFGEGAGVLPQRVATSHEMLRLALQLGRLLLHSEQPAARLRPVRRSK